jgi:hypothetical protein
MSDTDWQEVLLRSRLWRVTYEEKIRWTWRGAGYTRWLLRDANAAVVAAVLRSPRLRPSEVERISRRTDVPPFVLCMLHEHPRWSCWPRVRTNLALNPRMPFVDASALMPGLADEALEYATVSRRVSPQIAERAAEILRQRRADL